MNNINHLRRLASLYSRPIAFHRVFVPFAGVTGAVFLSQLLYWSDKARDPEGWIYKTRDEWEDETGLTRYEQETVRKKLKEIKVLEEKKEGMPRRTFYRLNASRLNDFLENTSSADKTGEIPPTRRGESHRQDGGNPTNSTRGKNAPIEYHRIQQVKNLSSERVSPSPNLTDSARLEDNQEPKKENNLHGYLARKKARKAKMVKNQKPFGGARGSGKTKPQGITMDEGLAISLDDNCPPDVMEQIADKFDITIEEVKKKKEDYVNWVLGSQYDSKVWGKNMRIYVEKFCERSASKKKVEKKKPKSIFEEIEEQYVGNK